VIRLSRPRDRRGRFIEPWVVPGKDGSTRTIVHIDPARTDEIDPPLADMLRALHRARAVRYVALALIVVLALMVAWRAR
jgi:hypothetical protein